MCQTQFLKPWKSVKHGVNTKFLPLRNRKKSFLHWKPKVCEICTIKFSILTKDNFTSFRKSVKTFCIADYPGIYSRFLQAGNTTIIFFGKRKAA